MTSIRLPIIIPPLRDQRYSCHGCGNCCKDFTVQLRPEDEAKLRAQRWEERLGEPVTVEFRGQTFLRQRDDGACIFWQEDGRCRIHAEFGLEEKPVACQMFPFSLVPIEGGAAMGLNFACQSVLENRGAKLGSHGDDLRRMASLVPELRPVGRPPMLTRSLRAETVEVEALINIVDGWLRNDEVDLTTRLDGLAWLVQSLHAAKLGTVRGTRFIELVSTLVSVLPEELDHLPIDAPSRGQRRMLRQAVYARTEDLKIVDALREGRLRGALRQLWVSRRFAAGRGVVPNTVPGWPREVPFADVESVRPAERDADEVDDLIVRFVRATVLGGRFFGAGYYGWSVIDGLAAVTVNLPVIGWLARLHAAGHRRDQLTIVDLRAAVGRVDRAAGRARWLGSAGERVRLTYLLADDGLRRLIREFTVVAD